MSTTLTSSIKDKARQLGFSLLGVTRPERPAHLDAYRDWIATGRHGEMSYLATERSLERRADPRSILPECRSILVLAAPYSKPSPETGGRGRVAAYAWGEDYHEVLPQKLKELVAYIESKIGRPVPNRWYTDSGPLLERELAQRAGLGWIGKNTMLINPQAGSYFLLAEILLGIELDYDQPITTDHCGTCTRCLKACPTSCILPDRTLDARHCISYLTIELKGPIDVELRPKIGDWVFGCDICQIVCPWNERFASDFGNPEFGPGQQINGEEELKLTLADFNSKFKKRPIKRTRRRGYLRNIAVALGNSKDKAFLPVLEKTLLHDSEPLVRGHAAWAIGRLGGVDARSVLYTGRVQEKDSDVIEEIDAALKIS